MSLNTITLSSSCSFPSLFFAHSLPPLCALGLTQKQCYSSSLSTPTGSLPIDEPTLLQILQKQLTEWFGTAGGVNSIEIDIVEMQPPASTLLHVDEDTGDREVILRFPRS